jgi:DNA-binding LacI/PurR family transcriptional regulator
MDKPSKPVTLQVIADRAGVTRALVSMALRNSPKVAKDTRARIQGIAEELGYQMNPMVRALMTGLRQGRGAHYHATLAFITQFPDPLRWQKLHTYPHYFSGARDRARELGYELEHFWLGEYAQDPNRLAGVLEARGIPGVLLPPLPQTKHGTEFPMDLRRFSAVTFGYSIRYPAMPRVSNHHLHTIVEAVERLAARGYRRIGIALHEREIRQVNYLWAAGVVVARCRMPEIQLVQFQPAQWGYEAFAEWVAEERPEVVIGLWKETLDWVRKLGKKVPEEIGFLHLDCEGSDTHAGMNQNTALQARAAVEMLISFIEGNIRYSQEEPRILMLNSAFHEGDTIWPPGNLTS